MRMPKEKQVHQYLRASSKNGGKKITIEYFGPLSEYNKGKVEKSAEIKKLGYGVPYLIAYTVGARKKKAILSTMRIGHGFGHDYRADRVDNQVLAYDTWNQLPGHCKVDDLGVFNNRDSSMLSLGESGEFFLVRKMVSGTEYANDLNLIFDSGTVAEKDLLRARALAQYLVQIHRTKNSSDEREILYVRKLRDTVGHGECVFGLADSYPLSDLPYLRNGELEEIEKKCIAQRWKLKKYSSRLSQVHGDFHPWNILFTNESKNPANFNLLDRSRGEWGEPADDICALSINYLFFSLRKYGEIKGEFLRLFDEFMDTYTTGAREKELFEAMPLFFAFRALVIASPIWYPDLSSENRRMIFNFTQNLLDDGYFDRSKLHDYFERGTPK
jgi:hypothetical protein